MLKNIFKSLLKNSTSINSTKIQTSEALKPQNPEGSESLIKFLEGSGPDKRGLYLNEVLGKPDEWLEATHDFIQWVFPLATPSSYQMLAPYLSYAQFEEIKNSNAEAKAGILRAYVRYLQFLGLKETNGAVESIPENKKTVAQKRWLIREDHNDLRITRVLKCLMLIGAENEAKAFYSYLETTFKPVECKEESLQYWQDALHVD